MNMCLSIRLNEPGLRVSPQAAVLRLISVVLALLLSACGGSGGGDMDGIASDGLEDPVLAEVSVQQDDPPQNNLQADDLQQNDQACIAEIDIAVFFLTEIDRQWACEINSVIGSRFDEIYFDRNGTASTSSGDTWYWNRNLPFDDINLASPAKPSARMTDIGSSNTTLGFRTIDDASLEETYDCVLVGRDISS